MNPQDLIQKFAREGAALTLQPAGEAQTFVIAAEILLTDRALVYYIAGMDLTGGVHRLEFDELQAPHALGVLFLREGETVAYLCPVDEDSAETAQAWNTWRQWVDANRERYEAAITAEFDAFTED